MNQNGNVNQFGTGGPPEPPVPMGRLCLGLLRFAWSCGAIFVRSPCCEIFVVQSLSCDLRCAIKSKKQIHLMSCDLHSGTYWRIVSKGEQVHCVYTWLLCSVAVHALWKCMQCSSARTVRHKCNACSVAVLTDESHALSYDMI